jgi:excisionase family DNA binding protein
MDKAEKMTPRLYTPQEVADVLKVHPATIRLHCRNGSISSVRVGKYYRIKEAVANDLFEHGLEMVNG